MLSHSCDIKFWCTESEVDEIGCSSSSSSVRKKKSKQSMGKIKKSDGSFHRDCVECTECNKTVKTKTGAPPI